MLNAQSPKYTALYDVEALVAFENGRAEVTEEQALILAKRPFREGILIEGQPAKEWARDRRRAEDVDTTEDAVEPVQAATEPPPDAGGTRKAR